MLVNNNKMPDIAAKRLDKQRVIKTNKVSPLKEDSILIK